MPHLFLLPFSCKDIFLVYLVFWDLFGFELNNALVKSLKIAAMPAKFVCVVSPVKCSLFTRAPLPQKCAVEGCSNNKRYSCSKTSVPLCSLQCYKKNLANHNLTHAVSVTWTDLLVDTLLKPELLVTILFFAHNKGLDLHFRDPSGGENWRQVPGKDQGNVPWKQLDCSRLASCLARADEVSGAT